MAVVYLHGSACYILDKDLGTRPLFRHLASQGHVVVDVAYRLFPETDVPGMVADAKRAVAWVRAQDKVCNADDPQPDWTAPPPAPLVRLFGDSAVRLRLAFMMYAGRCDWLLGGTPAEVPERYSQVSAFTYIRPDCPPTLLMHGTQDEMAPVSAARQLQARLQQAGVPATAVYLPHTDHMFDLIGTRWSPAARVAFHTLERFLAVLSYTE